MTPKYLAGTLALIAAVTIPALAQTPPVEEMPLAAPEAPMTEAPPMSKLPGAVPESPTPPAPPMAEMSPPAPPVDPVQAVMAPPPPPPQAVYPPCTATLRDQCTNSSRSAGRGVKRKPHSRR